MKKLNIVYLLLIGLFVVSPSCTVEKRLYNKGFHVQWNKKIKSQVAVSQEKDARLSSETPEFREDLSLARIKPTDFTDEASSSGLAPYQNDDSRSKNGSYRQMESNSANLSESIGTNDQLAAQSKNTKEIKVSLKEHRKSVKKLAAEPTVGTSQIVALLLAILVGVLGVHRFYLGYYGIGVLMILTLGCCGILALVDLIRIAIGDLKPKYGEYTETL